MITYISSSMCYMLFYISCPFHNTLSHNPNPSQTRLLTHINSKFYFQISFQASTDIVQAGFVLRILEFFCDGSCLISLPHLPMPAKSRGNGTSSLVSCGGVGARASASVVLFNQKVVTVPLPLSSTSPRCSSWKVPNLSSMALVADET